MFHNIFFMHQGAPGNVSIVTNPTLFQAMMIVSACFSHDLYEWFGVGDVMRRSIDKVLIVFSAL